MTYNKFCLIERASSRQLIILVLSLILIEIGFVLVGGYCCPAPTFTQIESNSLCVSKHKVNGHPPILQKDCSDRLSDYESVEELNEHLDVRWPHLVFTFSFPINSNAFYHPAMRFIHGIIEPILRSDNVSYRIDPYVDLLLTLVSLSQRSNRVQIKKNPIKLNLDCSTFCEPQFLFKLNHLTNERLFVYKHSVHLMQSRFPSQIDLCCNIVLISQSPEYTQCWAIAKTTMFIVSLLSLTWLISQARTSSFDPSALLALNALANAPLDWLLMNTSSISKASITQAISLWLDVSHGIEQENAFAFSIFEGDLSKRLEMELQRRVRFYVWLVVSVCCVILLVLSFTIVSRNDPISSVPDSDQTRFEYAGALNLGLYALLNIYLLAFCVLYSPRDDSLKDEIEMENLDTMALIQCSGQCSIMDALKKQSLE
ncbi:hypothetical protein ACOME3_008029 [Neoechinorhynchus agilis]